MAYHEKMNTSIKAIVEYQANHLSELYLNVDISDLAIRCWRCGEIRRLHRCHIIPASSGGKDSPENYVLLCNSCHETAPNTTVKERFFEWLYSTHADTYDSFWLNIIEQNYKMIYQESLAKEIILRYNKNQKLFKELEQKHIQNCKTHIGQGRLNVSTWVAFWKNLFDDFDIIYKKNISNN